MTTTVTEPVGAIADDANEAALSAISQQYAQLVGTVIAHATALLDASAAGDLDGASSARRELVLFSRSDVLPFSIAAEDTIYDAVRSIAGTEALVESMIADHRVLAELIDDLAGATTPLGASAAGHALRVLYELHVDKENDFLLPLLSDSSDISLPEVTERLAATFAELQAATSGGGCGSGGCGCGGAAGHGSGGGCGCGGGGCGCGGGAAAQPEPEPAAGGCGCGNGGCGGGGGPVAVETPTVRTGRPVLDARAIPRNIRHATIFDTLNALEPGDGMELIAPHDPLPLLAQLEAEYTGKFDVSYLERGQEAWRLAIDRK